MRGARLLLALAVLASAASGGSLFVGVPAAQVEWLIAVALLSGALATIGLARVDRRTAALPAVGSITSAVLAYAIGGVVLGMAPWRPAAWLSFAALRAFGFPASYIGGEARAQIAGALVGIAPTAFDLAFPALFAATSTMLALRWVASGRAPGLVLSIGAMLMMLLFSVLRHVVVLTAFGFLVGFFSERGAVDFAAYSYGWVGTGLLVGALPGLAFLVGAVERRTVDADSRSSHWAHLVTCAATCVAIAAVAGVPRESWGLGDRTASRVLVDDSHSDDWEIGGLQFSAEWRGDMSVYSCSSVWEALSDEFHVRFNRDGELDSDTLTDTDILVLKVPSEPLTGAELAAVDHFVRDGGRVVLIGDHTDLFGCNSSLNEVGAPLGIEFEPTAVADWSGRQAGVDVDLGSSALARVSKEMRWLTGCSVRCSGSAWPLLVWRRGHADQADFSNSSFFGDAFVEPSERCEPLVLAAMADHGKGAILAIGDGTILTNFAVFRPGRFEMFAESLRMLASYSPSRLRWIALAILWMCAGWLVFAARTPSDRILTLTALSVGGAIALLSPLVLSRAPMPRLVLGRERPRAAFLGVDADYHLAPTIGGSNRPMSESYDPVFVEVQRFGIFPRFVYGYEPALSEAELLVIPNALPTVSDSDLQRVVDWVRRGGGLLVTCGEMPGTIQGLERYATALGIGIDGLGESPLDDELLPRFRVRAPYELLRSDGDVTTGFVLLSWRVGEGIVTFGMGGESFSRRGLGHPFRAPDSDSGPIYEALDAHLELHAGRVFGSPGRAAR